MPLTEKGRKILSAFEREYPEKGKEYFYAARNKGTITGVDSDGTGGLDPEKIDNLLFKFDLLLDRINRLGRSDDAETGEVAKSFRLDREQAEAIARFDAEFNEAEHPRDESGKFSEGSGTSSSSESNAPIRAEHHRLQTPLKIERETEKAYAAKNPDYERAKEAYDWGGNHALATQTTAAEREAWMNRQSLNWYPKSHVSAHEGHIHGMSPWLASKSNLMTEERTAQREKAFQSGKERYEALLEKAKAAGVPGIRNRMKTATIKEKMRAHGVAVDSQKASAR